MTPDERAEFDAGPGWTRAARLAAETRAAELLEAAELAADRHPTPEEEAEDA